jgi:hypothetical protein
MANITEKDREKAQRIVDEWFGASCSCFECQQRVVLVAHTIALTRESILGTPEELARAEAVTDREPNG